MRTYLTAEEAKDFHKLFMLSFIIFTVIAILAHILVWQWRPWLPPIGGYKDQATTTASVTGPVTPAHG